MWCARAEISATRRCTTSAWRLSCAPPRAPPRFNCFPCASSCAVPRPQICTLYSASAPLPRGSHERRARVRTNIAIIASKPCVRDEPMILDHLCLCVSLCTSRSRVPASVRVATVPRQLDARAASRVRIRLNFNLGFIPRASALRVKCLSESCPSAGRRLLLGCGC